MATWQTRAVVTPTVATAGISPSLMGLSTARPHLEVTRRNRRHMGGRVRVRCPVEIHTSVSKAKAELLGLVDRNAHLPRFAGVPVPTDHVLKDDPPREHVHRAAHLAI